MMAMAFVPGRSSQEWGNLVRQASPGQTRWPKISIWHGSHDEVVAPANGSALVRQWIDIHQVDEAGATQDEVDGQTRMSWRDSSGAVVVEHFAIDGMAHGVPIDAKMRGSSGTLALAPFMLDVGMSSTFHIAKSWGLLRQTAAGTKARPPGAMTKLVR
jgi:poly(3-hydroxybutyrate) depolymerase